MSECKCKWTSEFIVKSKVKEVLSKKGFNSSACVIDALNCVVGWYLDQAAGRAKENGRKTVRGYDIYICK
ncbi:MAG TPA: hypothetical protein PK876_02220 [Elusimicrobiota bacterium]|nr:hypothetical protein [Elusimicrobiota bacterium]